MISDTGMLLGVLTWCVLSFWLGCAVLVRNFALWLFSETPANNGSATAPAGFQGESVQRITGEARGGGAGGGKRGRCGRWWPRMRR